MERRPHSFLHRQTNQLGSNPILLGKLSSSGTRLSVDGTSSLGDTSRAESSPRRSEDPVNEQSPPTSDNELDEKEEYPTTFRLVLITIGLCLCVFCIALVIYYTGNVSLSMSAANIALG